MRIHPRTFFDWSPVSFNFSSWRYKLETSSCSVCFKTKLDPYLVLQNRHILLRSPMRASASPLVITRKFFLEYWDFNSFCGRCYFSAFMRWVVSIGPRISSDLFLSIRQIPRLFLEVDRFLNCLGRYLLKIVSRIYVLALLYTGIVWMVVGRRSSESTI